MSALASGLAYTALCVTAVKILVGSSTTGEAHNPKRATAGVLGWTGGPLLVGITGAIFVGVAVFQGYKGVSPKFLEDTDTTRMSQPVQRSFVQNLAHSSYGPALLGVAAAGLVGFALYSIADARYHKV